MDKIWLLLLGALVSGCTSNVDKTETRIEGLLTVGLSDLKRKDYDDAVSSFKEIDRRYPYSATAADASILIAYSWYLKKEYEKAIHELEVFLKYRPNHRYVDYVMYMRGVCLLKQVTKVGRSQENTLKARDAFIDLVQKYPDSEYSKDADDIIVKLDTSMAAHYMSIAKYYQFRKKDYLAATGRYLDIVQEYLNTNQAPEAMYRLIECYISTGLTVLAKEVYSELNRLFPNSIWRKKSVIEFAKLFRN